MSEQIAEREAVVRFIEDQARKAKEYGFGEATILLAAAARDIKRGEHRKDEHD